MKKKLMNDLKEAMSEKDTIRKNTIQGIRAAILQIEKDKQIEADNKLIEEIISKEKKKRVDALEQFKKANREDLIAQTEKEINILESYLPKQLSDDELSHEVWRIINEQDAWTIEDDFGRIMRASKLELGNKVDGKRLSDMVKKKLIERSNESCQ